MLERLGRLCVGLGVLWVLLVTGLGVMVGMDQPEALAPYLDGMLGADLRKALYMGMTFVVVPVGMLMLLRDMFGDPEPLWLKLAAPGVFASVYALFLAAAVPHLGQPLLLAADPLVTQFLPGTSLTRDPGDGLSWLTRFGALLVVLAAIPGAVGVLVGLVAGGSRGR
jgi:hypothetical protein